MKLTQIAKITLASLSLIIASCSEDKKETTQSTTPSETSSVSLNPYLLTEAPAGAVDIQDLRKTANPGDLVTISGKAIGKSQIFMKDRAVMVLGDPKKLTSCDLRPGDGCTIPWDVCCDLPKDIKDSIITVQIIDDAGKPLQASIKGLGGIKELSEVIITGEVAAGSNDQNMLVNATGIFVKNSTAE